MSLFPADCWDLLNDLLDLILLRIGMATTHQNYREQGKNDRVGRHPSFDHNPLFLIHETGAVPAWP